MFVAKACAGLRFALQRAFESKRGFFVQFLKCFGFFHLCNGRHITGHSYAHPSGTSKFLFPEGSGAGSVPIAAASSCSAALAAASHCWGRRGRSRRGGARAVALCVGATRPLTSRCTTFAIYPAVTSSPSRNLIAPFTKSFRQILLK